MKKLLLLLLGTVAISTTASAQALWLRYPSISPDGKNIVFSYRGDLYLVPAAGGIASPLTVHEAYDYAPVWSPDGRQIAFASNRHGNFDVFLISLNGGDPRRLTVHSTHEIPSDFTPDGKQVLFSAQVADVATNVQFPSEGFSELYSVPVEGGKPVRIKSTVALDARISKNSNTIVFTDWKGYEDNWRKHHQSAVTRDVWVYDVAQKKHTRISSFKGEDRNPVFSPDQKEIFFLTEQFGDFNVARVSLDNPQSVTQVTSHQKHPVRFLSVAGDGTLCYTYNGEIYTRKPGAESQKVNVMVLTENKEKTPELVSKTDGATEFAISPEGKEVAVIVRGEIFVTSTEHGTTKRITYTPEQERSVSFSPDGRTLLYASERGSSWKIYQTKLTRKEEKLFALSTILKEEPVLETELETFQPRYSPDGKEVAYLEERRTLKVINLATKQSRLILDGKYNYSYSDGDQWFDWSPDGRWFLVSMLSNGRWSPEVGLVDAQGKQTVTNLTNSGYEDASPQWMQKGKCMIWFSDRYGMRAQASWGSQLDVFAMFFTRDAWNKFKLNKEEFEMMKEGEKGEEEKKEEKNTDKKKDKEEKDKEKEKEKDEAEKKEPVVIDLDHLEDRKVRLTIHSSDLSDAILSHDGEQLYYLARFEKGYDLWVHKFREAETKLLLKLEGNTGGLQMDKDGKYLFAISGGNIIRIKIEDNEQKSIGYHAELTIDRQKERSYMFEHAWRQVKKKFYNEKMHGVDWDFYKKEYSRFLPHINNNWDYTQMLSEMLGELNGSHTGSGYMYNDPAGDETASLGAFFDNAYTGPGLKIVEVIDKGPLDEVKERISAGMMINKIDGVDITPQTNYYTLLNHKAGKPTLLNVTNPVTKKTFDVVAKPISPGQESELLYNRWVKKMRDLTDKLSGGKIGYTHVRGMDEGSFRESFSEILGRNVDKKALIVDTRFNGGGWLHDDLASLLGGKKYVDLEPRGQHVGAEPANKWYRPSIVLMSESNYSDAHFFPFTYKALNIGKLVGMPVPGTATAVWWEVMQDNTIYFGIPQVGVKDNNGNYLENQQLEPDVRIAQDMDVVVQDRDEQLEKAVETLLKELPGK
jgi:tricorn protease